MNERAALLTLTHAPKIGPVTVRRLIDHFSTAAQALDATPNELAQVKGVGQGLATIIAGARKTIDLKSITAGMKALGLRYLIPTDDEYPAALREIYDPPFGLFIRGEIQPSDNHGIAVVGSRRCTHYGLNATKNLCGQMARAGLTVISGFARGIDTAAHKAAIDAGGRTIAVLGSGLGNIYPPENKSLADRIVEENKGAILSEFPIHMSPNKQSFPLRNRIVSGMSKGILVVEAPAWSGAMITANLAADQGRTVYAVPGPIDHPTSAGCHKLIKDGATLTASADDILDDLEMLLPPDRKFHRSDLPTAQPPIDLPADAAKIYAVLDALEQQVDDIIDKTNLPAAIVTTELMRLEMLHLTKQLPGRRFVKLI